MKKRATKILLIGLALSLALVPAAADAQVGGARDRSAAKPIGPQGYSKGRPEPQQQPDAAAAQRNAWLQGDERQQDQLTGCYQLSETLARHSRDIRKMVVGEGTKWKDVSAQLEDLGRGVELLTERHEHFVNGLNNGQRSWWEKPLQEIMSIQLLLSERMTAINRDIREGKTETVPMMKAFTDLEGQFRKWNETYGRIATDMGLEIEQSRSASGVIRGLPGAQGPGR